MPREKKSGRVAPLEIVMRTFRLRPSSVVAEAARFARLLRVRKLSRNHLLRIRNGARTSQEKMILLVATLRAMTGWPIRVTDLFDVEPLLTFAGATAVCGDTLAVSVFSPQPQRLASAMDEIDDHSSATQVLDRLYRENCALLLSTAICRYHVPPKDADGLVHDVFASYLERQPKVGDSRAYLLGAIRNASRHYWRKRAHESPFLPAHAETSDDATAAGLDRWALNVSLSVALSKLGDKCRQTLFRYYFAEERPDSIARDMNTTPGNVSQILHTCRRRIREIFRALTEPKR
ncbi:MAG TPA: sigma-70 family RNA polymerase sigma factor [Thermoanaerobaculia bacterium]